MGLLFLASMLLIEIIPCHWLVCSLSVPDFHYFKPRQIHISVLLVQLKLPQGVLAVGLCNKVAGIISPIVLSAFVLKGIDGLEKRVNSAPNQAAKDSILYEFAKSIYLPYIIMAGVLLVIALLIMRSSLPEIRTSESNMQTDLGDGAKQKNSIFDFSHLWLGALCIFVYVGVEVMAGDAIGTYGKGFHIPTDETKYFTSYTLAAMLLGYIIGLITIPKYIT